MHLAVLFENLGPYHRARLLAASADIRLTAVQVRGRSREYQWDPLTEPGSLVVQTLDDRDLTRVLDEISPDVIALPGWSSPQSFTAMNWALKAGICMIAMSASTREDAPRNAIKEGIKRRFLQLVGAGLVGGTRHRAYFLDLGMPADRIFEGYDAVDNNYFWRISNGVRERADHYRELESLPQRYFVASSRFVEKKNLPRLLDAYAIYRRQIGDQAWDLVIVGDGELRSQVEAQRRRLGLDHVVHLPGFKQYEKLPIYYALADGFVHASTIEQWGLVVNEAMACGLPVLVSERCGCATDLVRQGENGWTFDPSNEADIASSMLRLAKLDDSKRIAMGEMSRSIVANWGCERFAASLCQAANKSMEVGPRSAGAIERTALRWFASRGK